ncbi:histidine kinase [uncultured Aquimarina sp.]|uniref:sensor histidine kinase n=1 Tax=uncultured Aquimarina sp. TaxID=575652 RepID=UPI00260A5E5B|nr:histidine kinase [uncultured Aquimarina sp.]
MISLSKNNYLDPYKKLISLRKGYRVKEIWIHIIIWLCFFTLPIVIAIPELDKIRLDFIFRGLSSAALFYVNYLLLVPKLLLKKKSLLYILISIGVLVSFNYLLRNFYSIPPLEKLNRFLELENESSPLKNLKYILPAIFSFVFFLLGGIFSLIVDFYKRDQIAKEIEAKRTETELRFLKTQLNPHFLFNSLNSLYSLVRNKSNEAPEAVITLSELMRYMLYEANQEIVFLKKEIDYIKNYVSLQRLRLANSENVKLLIRGNYEDKKIYPLLLISFIENAFKYGTDFKGNTIVDIKIEITKNVLVITVRNIIGTYRKNEDSSGIGLNNIKNRLELLYKNTHTLTIIEEEGFYTIDLTLTLK